MVNGGQRAVPGGQSVRAVVYSAATLLAFIEVIAMSCQMSMHRAFLTLALAVASSMPALASPVTEIAWDTQGRFAHEQDIAPGKFAEVCGKLTVGQKLRRSFEAAAPLDFNVHYHQGKDVVYAVQGKQQRRSEGVLKVTAEPDHCWMWSNKSDKPARLGMRLER